MADDRDELYGDSFGEGDSHDADRWPANDEGPQGDLTPPQGTSKTVKVLLIVLGMMVLGTMFCCCLAGLIGWFAEPIKMTDKPEEVVARTDAIVEIDLPDNFTPAIAIDMNMLVVQMQMVFYETPGRGVMMIAQAQGEGANQANPAQMEQQFRQSMRQQNLGEALTIQDTETRTITIDGKEVDFEFATATSNQDGSEWKQVSGSFPGKNGTAFLMLQQPSTSFDENEATRILDSIGTE